MVALFNAGPQSKVEDIEDLVYTKWPQLIEHKFKLSCLIGDVGEIFLEEDSELASVISICHEVLLRTCDVHVQVDANDIFDVAGLGNNLRENRATYSIVY